MRLSITGTSLAVTIKSEKELTTQQIVAANQLATGNFEALFINDNKETEDEVVSYEKETRQYETFDGKLIEKGAHVYSEVLCQFCGFTGKTGTRWGNSFCKCPSCQEKLFNEFVTEIKGEVNSYGCHYKSYESMKFKTETDEFSKIFKEEK